MVFNGYITPLICYIHHINHCYITIKPLLYNHYLKVTTIQPTEWYWGCFFFGARWSQELFDPEEFRDAWPYRVLDGFVMLFLWFLSCKMGMDQYLLIQFLVGWTSIYQLFWCSPGVQGFDTLPDGNDGKNGWFPAVSSGSPASSSPAPGKVAEDGLGISMIGAAKMEGCNE